MPRIIRTFEDRGQNREIDALWQAIDDLRKSVGNIKPVQKIVENPETPVVDGNLIVAEADGDPSIQVSGIIFDQSDGFAVSAYGNMARIDFTGGGGGTPSSATPEDVASVGAAGTSSQYSRGDHAHRGVRSLAKASGTQLFGDVTLSEGSNVTITQSSNDLQISAAAVINNAIFAAAAFNSGASPYTAGEADCYIRFYDPGVGSGILNLPDPSTISSAHLYVIANTSLMALTIHTGSGATLDTAGFNGAAGPYSLAVGKTMSVMSDSGASDNTYRILAVYP